MHMKADQRHETRVPLTPSFTVCFRDTDELERAGAVNISLGGMFIASPNPRAVGSFLDFEVNLADEVVLVKGRAVVVWVRLPDSDPVRTPGMGIRFISMDPVSRGIIFRLVDKVIQSNGVEPFELDAPPQWDEVVSQLGPSEGQDDIADEHVVDEPAGTLDDR